MKRTLSVFLFLLLATTTLALAAPADGPPSVNLGPVGKGDFVVLPSDQQIYEALVPLFPLDQAIHDWWQDRQIRGGGIFDGTITVFGSTITFRFNNGKVVTVRIPVQTEVHSAKQNSSLAVQDLQTAITSLSGETSDETFKSFRLIGGDFYGLPSPGRTQISRTADGSVKVTSWFDVAIRAEWEGADTGSLAGQSGVIEGRMVMVGQPRGTQP